MGLDVHAKNIALALAAGDGSEARTWAVFPMIDLMGQYCRRMKGRLGKAEGIVAVAHKLARIVYAMITTGKGYNEKEAFKVTPSARPSGSRTFKNKPMP